MQLIWNLDKTEAILLDKIEYFQINRKMSDSAIDAAPFIKDIKERLKQGKEYSVRVYYNSCHDYCIVFEADTKEACVDFIESITSQFTKER